MASVTGAQVGFLGVRYALACWLDDIFILDSVWREQWNANKMEYALEHNLLAEKAYPQQSEQAFATYYSYVERGRKIPNLRYVGRHSEFKYWGMPETVNSAYQKSLEFPPV